MQQIEDTTVLCSKAGANPTYQAHINASQAVHKMSKLNWNNVCSILVFNIQIDTTQNGCNSSQGQLSFSY